MWCSLVNTSPCQGEDHGFESRHPRQTTRLVFYVYILKSFVSGKCYIGCTDNLLRRFSEHSLNQETATRHRGPSEMIHWEAYPDRQSPLRRERDVTIWTGF